MELSKRRKTVTAPPQTRSQSWQLSSPGISSLDDNLIFEILTRLSNPRSVLRCKSVCKRWNSLISTPDFLPDFLRRIATHGSEDEFPLLFPQSQQETMGFLPIPDKYRPRFRVLASCHDLILCGLTTRDYVENWFYVCNPFTKQWVILPLAPNRGEALRSQRIMVGFVCQPCYSYCGFKDQVLIDSQFKFRVVILYENGGAVFCSESGKWVDRFNHFQEGYGHFVTSDSHITLPSFDGKVYWKDDDSRQLVGFDPFDIGGVVETIDFSELYSHSPQLVCRFDIGVSKGSLHMIVAEQLEGDDSSVDGLSVWRLEGKKNWKLENRMSLRSILGRFNLQKNNRGGLMNSLEVKGVLGMHPSKPEIVYLAYANFGACYAVSCNFKSEELELCGTSTLESRFCWNVFQPEVPFWPTPVPVPTYDRVVFSYVDGRTDSIVAHSNVVEPSELNSGPGRRMSFSWMRMIFWKMIMRV
ncbi:unnamed protein product [Linum tenue]|uniref:F-box domain-containing protein n=1 Tax=Linum tenue TaxID=586396 RepID=A0AAV0Q1C0_9ROSI|nr:unnamed protein product [Linum tenue]